MRTLPRAETVSGAQSDTASSIKSPVLRGWLLVIAVWLLESAIGSWILEHMWRKSGIQQALRDIQIPESPSFQPIWSHVKPEVGEVDIEILDPKTRAALAAHIIPGFKAIRDMPDSTIRTRRWEIADYAQAYESGLVSPVEVAESIIERLQELDESNRIFISQDPEHLLQQARMSSSRLAGKARLSPLDGVPFAVIDAIDALPYPTTAGTSYLAAERQPTESAPAVLALREAGAMLVGKTTCHELGIGMTGINLATGTARNPYDSRCSAGGAASGCAAVVSAGLCAFALGVDGGGSVRVPAALCGIVGMKPTVGRTSHRGCPETAFSIMSHGPLTACVGDAMLVNAVISNSDTGSQLHPPSSTTIPRGLYNDLPGCSESKPLKGKRLGVHFAWTNDARPEVTQNFKKSLRLLAELGCKVVDVDIPELELIRIAQIVSIGCEIAQACKAAYADPKKRQQMNLDTRVTLASTTRFLATDFLQAQKIRTRLMVHMRRIFEDVELIASPTVGLTAPIISGHAAKIGESDLGLTGDLMRFTIPINMAGLPAITIPTGLSKEGMPIGLQLIGKPWQESDLFFAASALESSIRKHIGQKLPRHSHDILYGT